MFMKYNPNKLRYFSKIWVALLHTPSVLVATGVFQMKNKKLSDYRIFSRVPQISYIYNSTALIIQIQFLEMSAENRFRYE